MAKFLGLGYPITGNTPQGYFRQTTDVDTIKADMLQLLLTYPGERVFLPQFGTPLRDLIFEPGTSILIANAKAMIAKSLQIWEPRVDIQQVSVTIGGQGLNGEPDADQVMLIQIMFVDPDQIKTVQQLDLQVPLAGGIVNTEPQLGTVNISQLGITSTNG
jgi:phage baseplate assembly protein W